MFVIVDRHGRSVGLSAYSDRRAAWIAADALSQLLGGSALRVVSVEIH